MKLRSYFFLAWESVFKMKKHSLRVMSSFAGIIFIFSAFFSYRTVLISKMDFLTYEKASDCYVVSDRMVDFSLFPEIDEYKVRRRYGAVPYTLDKIILEIGGEERLGQNTKDYDFGKNPDETDRNVYFDIDAFAETRNKTVLVAEPDKKEFETRFASSTNNICVEGKLELAENEVIVSDYYLERFGYSSDDFAQLIGKEITFRLSDGERIQYWLDVNENDTDQYTGESLDSNILLGPVKLVGVINSDYFLLNAHGNDAQIIVAENHPQRAMFSSAAYYYYSSQFETSIDLVTRLKTLGIIDKSNVTLDTYSTLNILNNVIVKVLFFVMCMLIIALVSNYLLASVFSYRETRYFMQMNRALGLGIHQLWFLKLVENLYLLVLGTIVSCGFLEIVNRIVPIFTEREIDMEIILPYTTILSYVFVGVVAMLLCVVLTTSIYVYLLKQRSLCEDLSCG